MLDIYHLIRYDENEVIEVKVLIAMDSFKGSLDAPSCCSAVARGFAGKAETVCVPISDGGEGWCDCLLAAKGGEKIPVPTVNAFGETIDGYFALLTGGDVAVVETAVASGIIGVPKEKLNPERASTYGTGVLLRAALESGAKTVILGLGGSATTDGGMGAMCALGVKFYDENGTELTASGANLQRIARADVSNLHPKLSSTKVLLACDVDAPFDGTQGAAYVFGPQKGADPEMVKRLDRGLTNLKNVILEATGCDLNEVTGAGAAGGLCGGVFGICNTEIRSGFELLCELGGFETLVKTSDLVITGEGKTDRQTLMGKVAYRIGKLAQKYGVPAVLLSGAVLPEAEGLLNHGFVKLLSLLEDGMAVEYAMTHTEELIETRIGQLINDWKEAF